MAAVSFISIGTKKNKQLDLKENKVSKVCFNPGITHTLIY